MNVRLDKGNRLLSTETVLCQLKTIGKCRFPLYLREKMVEVGEKNYLNTADTHNRLHDLLLGTLICMISFVSPSQWEICHVINRAA